MSRLRRSTLGTGLVLVIAALITGCAGGETPRPTRASPAEIRAFLAAAKRGFAGSFTLTYATTIAYGHGAVRRLVVKVAQRAPNLFSYRTTPSLDLSSPGGPPTSSSYQVFVKPVAGGAPGAGLYSCRKQGPSSHWSCEGPYKQIGMGGTYELLGPYPPQALMLGLDNAYAVYRGAAAPGSPVRSQPAFLVTRRNEGQVLRCLEFGPIRDPVGTVCLRPGGVVASYDLLERVTSGVYETAILRTYSPGVSDRAFNLPARPRATS